MYKRSVAARESLGAELDAGFRTIAEAMPQLAWSATASGAIDYLNQRWIDYTGVTLEDYSREDGSGLDVVHPEEFEETQVRWRHAIASGEPYEIEHRIKRRSDGTYRWFLERAVPIADAGGVVVR
ncbi:MAG TPA: PAS domain-containing protein, partial [Candidatus Baltobacteraceae bacterium]|nr:PAS domain-containing protein [Candidatus Baltobacteraceae bacterium]